jgi:Tfp pilus assembly protein PilX
MIKRLARDEAGVAMVTVLLVAAALTALTSAAAFVTIDEFKATQADRNSAQALAFAESGIDRLMLEIRKGNLTWNNISFAGCDATHPKISVNGSLGAGTYTTTLEVYNRSAPVAANRFIPTACSSASSNPKGIHSFLLTSTGSQPQARKVIRQVIDIKPLGLPVGIYAYERIDANGTINMENISMVTEGVITNRDNIGFRGLDPYYTLGDFYGNAVSAANSVYLMPSAVHAKGAITYGAAGKFTEHRSGFEPNCDTNTKGTNGQSLWDGSGTAVLATITTGCAAWPGATPYPSGTGSIPATVLPPYSRFTEDDRKRVAPSPTLNEQDYLTLREAAKQNGVYCTPTGSELSCTEPGGPPNVTNNGRKMTNTMMDSASIPNNFVIYVDFPADGTDPFSRKVEWTGGTQIGPCNTNPNDHRSAVWVIRNGSFDSAGGARITGAMLIPEGKFESSGNFTLEGTIIARRFESKGNMTIRMSECWLANMPGPFLDVTPASWSEVDR